MIGVLLLWLLGNADAAAPQPPAQPAAPAAAPTPPTAAPCRLEWRATSHGHGLDDACLPALSADGERLAVTRIESGSFTILILSVRGKGREVRSFHAYDVSDTAMVKGTLRAINQVLARDGYRRLPEMDLPDAKEFTLRRGGLELRFGAGRLEAFCGTTLAGRSRKLGTMRDESLGLHHQVLTGLFLPGAASFALMKVELVNDEGFYLPGGVEWFVVLLTARCP
jgi:hypothetical protein